MARPRKPVQTLELETDFLHQLFSKLENGKVEIPQFGTFEVVRIPPKTLYHNFSKKMRKLPAYRKLKFVQNPLLKKTL